MAITDFGDEAVLLSVKPVHCHPVDPVKPQRSGKYITVLPDHHLVGLRTDFDHENRMAHGKV